LKSDIIFLEIPMFPILNFDAEIAHLVYISPPRKKNKFSVSDFLIWF